MKRAKISAGAVLAFAALGLGFASSEMSQPARTGAGPVQTNVHVIVKTKQSGTWAIPITARLGDQLVITLDSNQTTGYRWQIRGQPNLQVLASRGSVYNEPSQSMPGRGGTESWSFDTTARGSTTFTLDYVRPWEKDAPPALSQQFTVTVK